ncbi:hypothetical protein Pla8534_19210 [Lignipirellula cremea]|uniref:Uncharacterized protein n=1 Tax=Lignipirellula cremea TaxID=2528010 RepID=A0A518DQL6_9BACT|nr:hypothetical protein Pla8534_19210 [Lignipirellula cremea]
MQNDPSPFSDNVRLLCRERRMTLKRLAELANVRYDWLRRAVANGLQKKTKLNEEQVKRLAECFNLSADKLFVPMPRIKLGRELESELRQVLDLYTAAAKYKDGYIIRLVKSLLDLYDIPPEDRSTELTDQLRIALNSGTWNVVQKALQSASEKIRVRTCDDCKGTGIDCVCFVCEGWGEEQCWKCGNRGCDKCRNSDRPACENCRGTGRMDCVTCAGFGIITV